MAGRSRTGARAPPLTSRFPGRDAAEKQSSALPNAPTTIELGYANSDYTFWNGLFLPAKTPREIADKLHQETRKAATSQAVVEKLAAQGIDPMPITAAEFDAPIKKGIADSIALVKAAGIKVN